MKHLILKLSAAIAMLLCCTKVSAHDFEVDGIYYNILGKDSCEVTFDSDALTGHYSGSVTIPSKITYGGTTYLVTSIGDKAFRDCFGLTNITIPNSVTSIGSSAFSGCSGLTNVEIPNSMTYIGDYAFSDCRGLTSVDISNSVTIIQEGTFSDCSELTSVDIPNSVTGIGFSAFGGCIGLTSVNIPNSVRGIVMYAFSGCTKVSLIVILLYISCLREEKSK